jgi:hypothetical protein
MTRERAQTLGSVTWAACWRKPAPIHVRSRHRAACVASVDTASSGPRLVIYEVRVGGRPSRALSVAQSGAPRCVNQLRVPPAASLKGMCRNIRNLYNFEPPATNEEVRDAALQYVRKITGFTKPSQANRAAFERAVVAVTEASARLLDELVTTAPPKDREVEAAKRRARSAQRYAA